MQLMPHPKSKRPMRSLETKLDISQVMDPVPAAPVVQAAVPAVQPSLNPTEQQELENLRLQVAALNAPVSSNPAPAPVQTPPQEPVVQYEEESYTPQELFGTIQSCIEELAAIGINAQLVVN
tara:strand:- start:55121 stop:55486 length:366 start_codon:yes stop_codon:yes gene_type:complete